MLKSTSTSIEHNLWNPVISRYVHEWCTAVVLLTTAAAALDLEYQELRVKDDSLTSVFLPC